jgi:TolB protein
MMRRLGGAFLRRAMAALLVALPARRRWFVVPLGARSGQQQSLWFAIACSALLLASTASSIALAQQVPSTPQQDQQTDDGASMPQTVEVPAIIGGQISKIPILLRDFTYSGAERRLLTTGEACEDILEQDLIFSDYLEVRREGVRQFSSAESRRPPQAIVSGQVSRSFGKVTLHGSLSDASSGELIFEEDYPLDEPPDRWTIHAFADDIVLYLTGERGVARTRVAFVGDATGSKEIYLVDYDGARLSRVTSLNTITISPAWSADGKQLAFTTYASGNPDLVRVQLGQQQVIAVSARPGINSAPAWHPNGQRIAAALSFEGNTEIYTMDVSGKGLQRLTFAENSIETSPTFSPTGAQITFVSDRTGQTQLYIMDLDGANTRRLTHLNGMCDSPHWSRDGDWIVFVARVDRTFDIFRVRPNGADLTRLTADSGNYENPRWAPDSRHIVYAQRSEGSRNLFVMAADGSGKRRLTWSSGDQYNPAWSPPLDE